MCRNRAPSTDRYRQSQWPPRRFRYPVRQSRDQPDASPEVFLPGQAANSSGISHLPVIQAKAEAEAAGILKKAEAMKQYGDAARQQMELDTLKVYFEQLPKIAEAVAKGYTNVDSIKMFGGNTSQLAGDIMTTVTQVSDGIKESTGIDPTSLLTGALQKKNNRKTTEKKDPVETTETLEDYTEVTE